MKNILYRLPFVLLIAVLMVGCEEEPLIYDAENGLTLVQFNKASAVIPTPEEGASTTVKVLVSTKSSTERVIEVQVDEEAEIDEEMSTASADQYEVSNLVIPANSYEGTITITSNYEALPETGSTELVLDLVGLEGQDVSVDKGTFTVELFRKCDFTSLAPSYTGTVVVPAWGAEAPQFNVTLVQQGEDLVFSAETLWGPNFVAWATGDDRYAGLYVYPGTITLNDETVEVTSEADYMLGGEGTYNACTGVFEFSIATSLFGGTVTAEVILVPNE